MVQFIMTPAGEELALLPRLEYEALIVGAGMSGPGAPSGGGRADLPCEVAKAIAYGGNPVRAVRRWRGLSCAGLADLVGLARAHLADIERGRRAGSPEVLRRLAEVLAVPPALLAG